MNVGKMNNEWLCVIIGLVLSGRMCDPMSLCMACVMLVYLPSMDSTVNSRKFRPP